MSSGFISRIEAKFATGATQPTRIAGGSARVIAVEAKTAARVTVIVRARRMATSLKRLESHRDTRLGKIGLRLAEAVDAEMEDRGRQHRCGVAIANALDQMIEGADAAGGDHRNPDRVGDCP